MRNRAIFDWWKAICWLFIHVRSSFGWLKEWPRARYRDAWEDSDCHEGTSSYWRTGLLIAVLY